MAIATVSASPEHPRRLARSTAAVAVGFIAVAALSLGVDEVLHVLGVYPQWKEPMYQPGLNLLALSYRMLFAVVGGYITARLAPHAPMRHVWILAIIGLVVSTAGAIAAITMANLGPNWYPIALAVSAVPTTWLGGVAFTRSQTMG